MADTIQNIKLPRGVAVDLYDASGITVGTQVVVENLTQYPIKLYSGATPPVDWENDDDSGYFSRVMAYKEKLNDSGDTGLWALSETQNGLVQVSINEVTAFDYKIEVAKENVEGVTGVAVVMRNPQCSNTELTDVWGGGGATYDNFIPPSAPVALEIRSDNVEDTANTGLGAWTVLVNTLDGNYVPQDPEEVELDGTNWVSIPGTHFRPHHLNSASGLFALTANPTLPGPETNIGTITVREVVSGNIWMTIQPLVGKSEDSNVTVPAGFTLFIRKAILTWSKDQAGEVLASVKPFGANTARISSGKLAVYQNGLVLDFQVVFKSTEKTDRVIRAKSSNPDVEVTIIQEYELIANDSF